MFVLMFLALVIFTMVIAGGWGCSGTKETPFSPVVQPEKPVASVPPAAEQTQSAVQPPEVSFSWSGPTLLVQNPTNITVDREICYFDNSVPAAQGQELLETQHVVVKPGQSGEFPLPDGLPCVELQIDLVGNRQCSLGSDSISPVTWAFSTVLGDCGPECEEEPEEIGRELVREGAWGACVRGDWSCSQTRVDAYEVTWKQCDTMWTTNERDIQTRFCDCGSDCVTPEAGTVLTWEGPGDPDTECAAFGPYLATELGGDFYLCKAGNDREVVYPPLPEGVCGNGKDISHITACECE